MPHPLMQIKISLAFHFGSLSISFLLQELYPPRLFRFIYAAYLYQLFLFISFPLFSSSSLVAFISLLEIGGLPKTAEEKVLEQSLFKDGHGSYHQPDEHCNMHTVLYGMKIYAYALYEMNKLEELD